MRYINHGRLLAILMAFGGSRAVAQDDATLYGEEEEIIVYADRFARWDDTRWLVETQLGTPRPITLMSETNTEMRVQALQIRTVFLCSKTWRLTRNRYEVDCSIEDMGLQAATYPDNSPNAQAILDELDSKLTAARFQLQVSADGKVTSIDIEGFDAITGLENRRTNNTRETVAALLSRAIVGFHMRLPKGRQFPHGQWVEYNNPIMSLPSVSGTQGSSMIINQLDEYQGHHVVQTSGKGTIISGDDAFFATVDGVSIYDIETGIMTERVWALFGGPTSSSSVAAAGAGSPYWHSGHITMLPDGAPPPDVGPTRQVCPPNRVIAGLPAWDPVE